MTTPNPAYVAPSKQQITEVLEDLLAGRAGKSYTVAKIMQMFAPAVATGHNLIPATAERGEHCSCGWNPPRLRAGKVSWDTWKQHQYNPTSCSCCYGRRGASVLCESCSQRTCHHPEARLGRVLHNDPSQAVARVEHLLRDAEGQKPLGKPASRPAVVSVDQVRDALHGVERRAQAEA